MVLGVDIGTTGVKALLLSEEGRVLAEAEHPHALRAPAPGFAEEDPEDWWQGLRATLARLLEGRDKASLRAIGLSGMVPALVLHDGEGRPLRPSLQQNDARAVREIKELEAHFGNQWLFARTGATWNQQVLAPKLLWLRRHEPQAFAQARWISGSYEHLAFRLTGERYQEANWALESGLWDPKAEAWLAEVLAYVGLEPDRLGPVRRPHEGVGEVTGEAARATGLPKGLPVIAGSADHIAAALASGLKEPGEAVVKLGGAGDFLYAIDRFAPVPELFIDFHDLPGLFVINGCMATTGSLLKWFQGAFRPGVGFAQLDAEAEGIPPGSQGLVVLPYFLGEKTPIHDPEARGTVVGLTLSHTPAHLWRALLEAVAYAFRHHLEVLEARGHRVERLFVMDGGARSPLWRRILASVLERPLERLLGGERGSAYGTAFLAGVAAGLWGFADLRREVAEVTEPEPTWIPPYRELYGVYREVYQRLKDLYPRLGGGYA
ncbi:MAG: FGGY family carbohydrate kinase [Thermus sp.]|uniref:FGGY-family carbohydrate kinase n=1 Tax=Thermus sp. TaxID=275 RepID=UPI00298EFD7B|nr:FGGY family carbohydrate kinase [Thermus sp.]MDW8018241.1 FGGY family carbohydrate kinase [Thermus sp.]MDW8358304.1 FGGY family carbohydrate kinase [Thermus sp.]